MVPDTATDRSTRALAPVLEVFASIQGEGAYLGELQTFLRLRGCPLRCAWCDTPSSWEIASGDHARIAVGEGPRREPTWASPFQAACWISEVEPGEPRTVSVTGGEPLVWPEFLQRLRPLLGSRRVHLETGGGHPRTLETVVDAFQHISIDLKLPADMLPPVEIVRPGAGGRGSIVERSPSSEREWAAVRRAVLEIVAERDACAKLIVAGGRAVSEFEPLLLDLERSAPQLPLYVQPVTPMRGVRGPDIELVLAVAEQARELGLRVRVVPQVHRALAVP